MMQVYIPRSTAKYAFDLRDEPIKCWRTLFGEYPYQQVQTFDQAVREITRELVRGNEDLLRSNTRGLTPLTLAEKFQITVNRAGHFGIVGQAFLNTTKLEWIIGDPKRTFAFPFKSKFITLNELWIYNGPNGWVEEYFYPGVLAVLKETVKLVGQEIAKEEKERGIA